MKADTKKNKKNLRFEAEKRIAESSFRMTQPRRQLLDRIFAKSGPFSVPELIKDVEKAPKRQAFDFVTIYRTIPVFEELGIIEKCDFSEGVAYYEVKDHGGHHHHHIVCKNCKRIEPLEFCVVEGQEQILQKLGYTSLSHKLEFTGLCPRCSR